MNLLQKIAELYLRNDLPSLQVGEKVKVFIGRPSKSDDKKEHKFSSFSGVIIKQRRKKQLNYAFAVINGDSKMIIKQTFFYHSPLIVKIEKLGKIKITKKKRSRKIRRVNLSFLERELAAKKTSE
jgi:ribosomal protein L19